MFFWKNGETCIVDFSEDEKGESVLFVMDLHRIQIRPKNKQIYKTKPSSP